MQVDDRDPDPAQPPERGPQAPRGERFGRIRPQRARKLGAMDGLRRESEVGDDALDTVRQADVMAAHDELEFVCQ